MKKKITAALVCAAMVLSLAGCAGDKQFDGFFDGVYDNNSGESKPTSSKQTSSKPTSSKSTSSKSEESKPEESKPDESKPAESSSAESTPESKPEEQQPVDPIDWSTVPYVDELDFLYEEVEGGVMITEYRGSETILKIPETINGKTVVALAERGVVPYSAIGLSIPNSVTVFPRFLIQYRDLQSVVLPDNYNGSTDDWGRLVPTPEFLDDYEEERTKEKTVFTYLGKTYQMPEDLIKLKDALYPGTGKILVSEDGVLTKVSIAIKDVVIPDNVTSIGEGAFENCDLIEDITIPGRITEINGDGRGIRDIFYNCPNLKSVTFAEGVTKIDGNIFYMCPKLETITLPDSLTHLGEAWLSGGAPKYLQVTYKGVTYKSNQLPNLYKAVNGN